MQAAPHESTTETITSQNSTTAVDEHTALPPPAAVVTPHAAEEETTLPSVQGDNSNNTPTNGPDSFAMLSRAQLEDRLRMSDEWNVRLQHQLQELLQLPQSDVAELRARMQSPEIAIPLLQCYDATIAEKTEEVLRLSRENAALRTRLERTSDEREGLAQAAQVAERLASTVEEKQTAQLRRCESVLRETEAELSHVRQELTRALSAESERKLAAERAEQTCAKLRDELARASEAKQAAEKALLSQQQQHKRIISSTNNDGGNGVVGSTLLTTLLSPINNALFTTNNNNNVTGSALSEAQRVQLALLSKESEDKTQELERLRQRMLQALRQSADNHAAHLRIVEERHKAVVEELRRMAHTQELEVLKLRAQLARLDPSSPSSQPQWELQLRKTGELLAEQARHALERELRRCQDELATVQRAQDGKTSEYEQTIARMQRSHAEERDEWRQAKQELQKKLEIEKAARNAQAEAALRSEQQLVSVREKLKKTTQELQESRNECERQAQALQELNEKYHEATTALEEAERTQQQAIAKERQRGDDLSERVRVSLNELQEMKDRVRDEDAVRERECAQLRRQLQAEQQRVQSTEAARVELERMKQTLEMQLGKLNEALVLHKRQIASCDAQVHQLQAQLELARQERRTQLLNEEKLKVENARLVRARDRLTDSLQARYY